MPEINFFWDPLSDNILQERDETGAVTAEYTAEPGLYGNLISQNRGGVESQFHYDAQGSTLAVTNDDQNVTDTFAYTAFGEVTERTGTTEVPFQYIGRKGYYRDTLTGQYLVRKRVYESAIARWFAIDDFRIATDDMSPYCYVTVRPLTNIDPSGRLTESLASEPKLQPCGAYTVTTRWELNPDERDGLIMQTVGSRESVETCATERLKRCGPPPELAARIQELKDRGVFNTGDTCPPHLGYLEIWTVTADGKILGRVSDPRIEDPSDTFARFGFGCKTKGSIRQDGVAVFIPNRELRPAQRAAIDAAFKQGSAGGVPDAGTLLSACASAPLLAIFNHFASRFSSAHVTLKHVEKAWNCCKCDPPDDERATSLTVNYAIHNTPTGDVEQKTFSLTAAPDDPIRRQCSDC